MFKHGTLKVNPYTKLYAKTDITNPMDTILNLILKHGYPMNIILKLKWKRGYPMDIILKLIWRWGYPMDIILKLKWKRGYPMNIIFKLIWKWEYYKKNKNVVKSIWYFHKFKK